MTGAKTTTIARAPLRTVRPAMLNDVYANPRKELLRLQRNHTVVKIAPATYTARPDTVSVDTAWAPAPVDAAMAYATAAYGDRVPVLFGIGAARFHHAIPRAIGATVVAVPEKHHAVTMTDGGRLVFTTTDVDQLDARLEHSPLGDYLVTTPEQTLLDLLERPTLGGMPAAAAEAIGALVGMVDLKRLRRLAATRTRVLRRRLADLLADGTSPA